MCLELIPEFDQFHIVPNQTIKHGNPGSGHTSYLSTCDEPIKLI